ncbi:MAG: hypothetical protein ABJN69_09690 [Hellea sp.]
MMISPHVIDGETEPHRSVGIIGKARSGLFSGQTIELQISGAQQFNPDEHYCGVLITTQPNPIYSVKIDLVSFGHIVTLIAAKAIKEFYLSYETPRYRKANVLSWHLSTDIEP